MYGNIKHTSIYNIEALKKKKKENGVEKIFEEIIAKIFQR